MAKWKQRKANRKIDKAQRTFFKFFFYKKFYSAFFFSIVSSQIAIKHYKGPHFRSMAKNFAFSMYVVSLRWGPKHTMRYSSV